ncbi:MAG TPA: hypothetical protein DCD96_05125 [Flavobacteriales bacterium]|nr:hypothetical protein [Flavobacteriales bacterium]
MLSVVVTDFRGRYVVVSQLLGVFVLGGISILINGSFDQLSLAVIQNCFVSLLLVGLCGLYFRFVKGDSQFLDKYFGRGDLYFLLALSPLIAPAYFIPFMICGLLIALFGSMLLSVIYDRQNGIPLAGWLAGFAIIVTTISGETWQWLFSEYSINISGHG